MRLGAHVSASGGLGKAIERAYEMGAETLQLFASSPRAWAFRAPSEDAVLDFRQKSEETGVRPVFLHGSYLVNTGGAEELVRRSVKSLTHHMNTAAQIGAAGVIFHSGSHRGAGFDAVLGQASDAMKEVLDGSPSDAWLIIENSAGAGDHIGSTFAEISRLIEAVGSDRVKVCLDTQHSMAASYNIADEEGVVAAMREFDDEIGLDRLVAVHANDSKVPMGSGVDRHENIGEGQIGIEGFETIMAHPAFCDVPFVLEVPGPDKKGPDKENLDRLKDIRSRLGIPV